MESETIFVLLHRLII